VDRKLVVAIESTRQTRYADPLDHASTQRSRSAAHSARYRWKIHVAPAFSSVRECGGWDGAVVAVVWERRRWFERVRSEVESEQSMGLVEE